MRAPAPAGPLINPPTMKTRIRTNCYAVLSINELRNALAIAEANSLLSRGEVVDYATVVLRGKSIRVDGKVQAQLLEVDGKPLFTTTLADLLPLSLTSQQQAEHAAILASI